MRTIRLLFLTLGFVLSLAGPAAWGGCADPLLEAQIPVSFDSAGPLGEPLLHSPNLIYNSGSMPAFPNAFLASNEWDYWMTPWDEEPTDMLVGFGTNSAWDLAVRKDAQEVVIADYSAAPLIGQAFVHAPLFKIAKTPAEYLCLLAGIPPPKKTNISFKKLLEYVLKNNRSTTLEKRHDLLKSLIPRLETEEEQLAVGLQLSQIWRQKFEHVYGPFLSFKAHERGNLYNFFITRYGYQHREPIPEDIVNHPKYSFLSSQEAYDKMRSLFVENKINYALTDFASPEFYKAMKKRGDAKGYTKYTFSITNIIGADSDLTPVQRKRRLDEFRKMLYEIFPEGKYEVIIFMTTNYKIPHGFLRLERDTKVTLKNI